MRILSCLFLVAFTAVGQRQRDAAAAVVSPELHADGRITFRLSAPKATEVTLRGEWMGSGKREALAKDEKGVWSVTVGPIAPDLYSYTFSVDGLTIADPRNPMVKLGARSGPVSLVDMAADLKSRHSFRDVPHGVVHIHHYSSRATGTVRRVHVYTPPGYDLGARTQYPVLYLLHGSGDTDAEWYYLGRAGAILDNQLAARSATKPMIIVMPDGHPSRAGSSSPQGGGMANELFGDDLLNDVMPLVERAYRVSPNRSHRALAGLSMGGGQTLTVGLANLDKFSHLGVFSMGARDAAAFEQRHASVLGKPEATNKQLKLFWIACGKEDSLIPSVGTLRSTLDKHGIKHIYRESEGGHSWSIWRLYLDEFYPMLFQ